MQYAGFREFLTKAMPFLLRVVSAQVMPGHGRAVLPSCVSPFNMLHILDQHPHANHKMLEKVEKVCAAEAVSAGKIGEEIAKHQMMNLCHYSHSKKLVLGEWAFMTKICSRSAR